MTLSILTTFGGEIVARLLATKAATSMKRIHLGISNINKSKFPELVSAFTQLLKIYDLPLDTPVITVVYTNGLASAVYEPSVANLDGQLVIQFPDVNVPLVASGVPITRAIQMDGNDEFYLSLYDFGVMPEGYDDDDIQLICRVDKVTTFPKGQAASVQLLRKREKEGTLAECFMKVGGQFPQKIAAVVDMAAGITYPLCYNAEKPNVYEVTGYRWYENTYEGRTTTEVAVRIKGFAGEYRANNSIKDALKYGDIKCSPESPLTVTVTGVNFKKGSAGHYAIINCHVQFPETDDDDQFFILDEADIKPTAKTKQPPIVNQLAADPTDEMELDSDYTYSDDEDEAE